jgi:O-antigen/teichoic acid export membrane protein
MFFIGVVREKLFQVAEILHLRVFGHRMSEEMRQFTSSLTLVFFGSTASSAILLFVYLFSARILGPSEFGKFQLVMTVGQFLLIFMLMGLSTASVQYLARQERNEKNAVAFTVFVTNMVCILLITVFVSFFSEAASQLLGVTPSILKAGIYFAGSLTIYHVTRSFLQGYKMMNSLSSFDLFYSMIIAVVVASAFSLARFDRYEVLSLAFIFGYISYGILALYKIFPKMEILFFPGKIKGIFHYAWYAFLGSATGFLLNNMDRLWLNHYFTNDIVGIYSAYMLVASVIFGQLTQIFVTVFFPVASGYTDQTAIVEKIKKSEKYILFTVPIISFLISAIVFKIIRYDFDVLFGLVFSFNSGLMVLWQVKMWLLNSRGVKGVRIVVLSSFAVGIINLFMCALLIPMFGVLGAGFTATISSVILYSYFTRKLTTKHLTLVNS